MHCFIARLGVEVWTHNPPARSHNPRQYIHNISLFLGHLAQAPLISAEAGEKPCRTGTSFSHNTENHSCCRISSCSVASTFPWLKHTEKRGHGFLTVSALHHRINVGNFTSFLISWRSEYQRGRRREALGTGRNWRGGVLKAK